jgi:hypothetical protein
MYVLALHPSVVGAVVLPPHSLLPLPCLYFCDLAHNEMSMMMLVMRKRLVFFWNECVCEGEGGGGGVILTCIAIGSIGMRSPLAMSYEGTQLGQF